MAQGQARRDRFIGFAVVLAVGLGGLAGLWQGVDGFTQDVSMRLAPERDAGDQVLLVDIDEASLERYGSWESLAPAVVSALQLVTSENARVSAVVLPRDWGLGGPAADQALSRAIGEADTVLLGLPYRSWPAGRLPSDLGESWRSDYLQQSLIEAKLDDSLGARTQRLLGFERSVRDGRLLPSFPGLVGQVDSVGFVPHEAGRAEVRHPPALLRLDDHYLPSLSLQLVTHALGGTVADIRPGERSDISVGGQRRQTTLGYRFQPHFYSGDSGIQRISLVDLLGDRGNGETLEGRVVILGSSAGQWADRLPSPIGSEMSPAEVTAHQTAAILNDHLYSPPDWMMVAPWAVLLVVGLYLAYLLPRVGLGTGIAVTVLLTMVLINVQLILGMAQMVHLPLAMPVIALVSGHVAIWLRRVVSERRASFREQLSEANRLLAESLQAQGRLDAAFDRYRQSEPSEELFDRLYNLGLDFERRRQFARAQSVLRYLQQLAPGFADVDQRIKRLGVLESKMALASTKGGARPLILTEDGMQKPMLGRYEIQKEIGRGAMGTVYLGRDPRIGRTVAVKTVALSEEFEGEELERVTARFFREAETAGRLNHPSIVTIYDVGEESDLAYIAMDYLDGSSLQRYTHRKKLLPVPTVFDIVIQVAEALDYAHSHNVVHRDVKPGNMIYDRRTRRIKVTDFGVACLTDTSKTKTGTILGTPSYMSPEQILGKRVDGRSDLFSLGVSFYQLLRGELPFEGEPLATLMYKIANEAHPDVRALRLDLPACLNPIMDRLLSKDPKERFQSGAELAAALRRCRREAVALAAREKEGTGQSPRSAAFSRTR